MPQSIRFSEHALLKMRQRRIDRQAVQMVIEKPDIIRSSYDRRMVAERNVGKVHLRVVFIEEANEIVVITTYYVMPKRGGR